MLFDDEIYHAQGLSLSGRSFVRQAVRAVVLRGDSILMIYSSSGDEYKFPGGGIEPGERHEDALSREVREEAGAVVGRVIERIGEIVEYDRPKEAWLDYFMMRSSYYLVTVEETGLDLRLDDYEARLGFSPRWVGLDEAIALNEESMEKRGGRATKWIGRETRALKEIRRGLAGLSERAAGSDAVGAKA
ncbi:MAG: NUDIX domain-containing protein [Spirochaetes bacterium]|nr:NUDIX domain-containing protein [Spirochaetota bacterium]MBU1078884.1 NUDIX domain-containing protein [Spirochaetota bacterium]